MTSGVETGVESFSKILEIFYSKYSLKKKTSVILKCE